MDAYSLYKDLNANYDGYRSKHLAGMAFNTQGDERQGHLAELAKYNPVVAQSMKKDLDESDKQGFIDGAKLLNSFRNNPEMANQAYQRLKPKLSALGVQMPDQLDDTVWQAVDQINSAYDVNNQKRVQSTQILQDGTIAYMDNNGNLVRTSEKARENYGAPIQTAGGFVSPNKNAPFAAPLTQAPTGGQPSMSEGDITSYLTALNQKAQELVASGVPKDKVNAWADAQVASLPQAVSANNQQYQAPVKQAGGMTEYQTETLAMAKAKEAQAQADRKAKIDNANMLKGEASRKRNEAVVMSVDDTLTTIDRLEKSAGYKELGTTFGDIKIGTPLIRNDAKDANATLQTLAGQIALSTMANLKTLSSAGATGFGALTAPELRLLQNSIATLQQDDVSNKQIVESIRIIKDKMQKIKESALGGSQPQAPSQDKNKVGRFIIESN